ncbi:MAG: hypothetical protein A2408_00455 [Candidatus Yonathbacteria bacterium RIFOXYC1_FULL_52_10]|uniref:Uncharacterized protein n=1 Tax=Candidatus Yonathbacteria bacterium RIFOXYD1_FULL_52_36 TaxID=1802730 RepID=A0A1G2SPH1_9BACT|nr:MAG: hypothetical protein A2408_00455 [Candidatus Yonathbacteria bacterium RIFOXYC1_FULL_52_10]OHA86281.1 MAG: hypothetical protein A2591_01825 [Candidatus Yonathbacteria bacterium RIFOXYD1_FULL_52_36]
MNNLLQELEKHFSAFIDLENTDDFYTGLVSYFRFIEETYPFNDIAHALFASQSRRIGTLANVNGLYRMIVFGETGIRASISPISKSGSGISTFHTHMIETVNRLWNVEKRKIVLNTTRGNKSICLVGEVLRCYPMKGDAPERFKIITILFKTETGKSAGEVAEVLRKNGADKTVQDNIKKEIKKINVLFRGNCEVMEDLVVHTKVKGKNIYSLNRKQFDFETKK